MFQKENWRDRLRRIKYFIAAIELIKNSHFEPIRKKNPHNDDEVFYRFGGITAEGDFFYVQIKECKKEQQKFLISIFPS